MPGVRQRQRSPRRPSDDQYRIENPQRSERIRQWTAGMKWVHFKTILSWGGVVLRTQPVTTGLIIWQLRSTKTPNHTIYKFALSSNHLSFVLSSIQISHSYHTLWLQIQHTSTPCCRDNGLLSVRVYMYIYTCTCSSLEVTVSSGPPNSPCLLGRDSPVQHLAAHLTTPFQIWNRLYPLTTPHLYNLITLQEDPALREEEKLEAQERPWTTNKKQVDGHSRHEWTIVTANWMVQWMIIYIYVQPIHIECSRWKASSLEIPVLNLQYVTCGISCL